MKNKERKQTNLSRIGLFETITTQPIEQKKEELRSEEIKSEDGLDKKNELQVLDNPSVADLQLPTSQKQLENRPMIRVGLEIYKDLDKKIELLVVEEGKKKRDVINELLELALSKR